MQYDLTVIGGGPGGYTGAIRAAQLGMKVLCIDDRKGLGGTCLNAGCIPSKVLLDVSERYITLRDHGEQLGIVTQSLSMNVPRMQSHKMRIVSGFNAGIKLLFAKNKIKYVRGRAELVSASRVQVVGGESYETKAILVATGSAPSTPPGVEADGKRVVFSDQALEFSEPPKKLIVIGGGVIGLELGSVWNRLGTTVDIVEFGPQILGKFDQKSAAVVQTMLEAEGLRFHLGTGVREVIPQKSIMRVVAEGKDGKVTLEGDKILVATGRKPSVEGMGLERLGVERTDGGFLKVDKNYQTSIPGVFAVGDCVGQPMLAHKAAEEAVVCVERMKGMKSVLDYRLIPGVVYTDPEVAYVGFTREELKERSIPYRVGQFPFMANARARATMVQNAGHAQIWAHAETDRILGATIVGPYAGELIMDVAAVMAFGGSAEDLGRISHPHPTFVEAVKEAALSVHNEAINI